jgi:hypothetical protein
LFQRLNEMNETLSGQHDACCVVLPKVND